MFDVSQTTKILRRPGPKCRSMSTNILRVFRVLDNPFFRVLDNPSSHKIKAGEVFFLGDIEGQHLGRVRCLPDDNKIKAGEIFFSWRYRRTTLRTCSMSPGRQRFFVVRAQNAVRCRRKFYVFSGCWIIHFSGCWIIPVGPVYTKLKPGRPFFLGDIEGQHLGRVRCLPDDKDSSSSGPKMPFDVDEDST